MSEPAVLRPAAAARRLGVPTRVIIKAMYEKKLPRVRLAVPGQCRGSASAVPAQCRGGPGGGPGLPCRSGEASKAGGPPADPGCVGPVPVHLG